MVAVDPETLEEMNPATTASGDNVWLGRLEMPIRATFFPLGFAVEIATNSSQVVDAAQESWGRFRRTFAEPPLRLHVGVAAGGPAKCPPAPIFRAQGNLLAIVADAGNFIVCDLGRGFAFGCLTAAAARNLAYVRYHFLEAAAHCLIESLYTTPVHGACVSLAGMGILLCGDSGAGKSSLAYACARSGWTLISEDCSSVVRKREDRTVAGNPYRLRFRASAVKLFPELRGLPAIPRASGKVAIELAAAGLPEIATAQECFIDYIVFLNRREPGSPALVPFPKPSALDWFERTLALGDEEIRKAQTSSLHILLAAEVLELRYRDLATAVRLLETLVQRGR